MITKSDFLSMVDHTLLKPEATHAQVVQLCDEALQLSPASVCVNSYWVPTVVERVGGAGIQVCSVVGFPLGSMNLNGLSTEIDTAIKSGATEIDMVLPVGLLKSSMDDEVASYLSTCRSSCGPDVTLKVILETALLSEAEIVSACHLAVASGADFVKTSTGFNQAGGATEGAVRLMRETVGQEIGVKASGGIRTLADVESMVAAGANRLGMSAAMEVVREIESR